MFDFLTEHLDAFHRATGWDTSHRFGSFAHAARTVLDFYPPHLPFHAVLGKSVSPHLKLAYSLGLPHRRSVSYLYSSVALPSLNVDKDAYVSSLDAHPKLVYGRLLENGHIEGLFVQRRSLQSQLLLSGTSTLFDHQSHLFAQWQTASGPWSYDFSFHSIGTLFGTQFIYQLPEAPLALGAEVFYTHAERSGGLSLGVRYAESDMELGKTSIVGTLNPMMVCAISAWFLLES